MHLLWLSVLSFPVEQVLVRHLQCQRVLLKLASTCDVRLLSVLSAVYQVKPRKRKGCRSFREKPKFLRFTHMSVYLECSFMTYHC